MKAIVLREFGGPEVLQIHEIPVPDCGPDDIVIRVHAAGLNRADLLERQGLYPPPDPQPDFQIPGLECAGVVSRVGRRVLRFREGDRVMALVTGGAYAEYVACPADNAWPIPENITDAEAAGIPEAFITAYDALFDKAQLHLGQRVLIHAGAGGVGSAAIQLARLAGLQVATTVGSPEKVQSVLSFGAEKAINYHDQDFVQEVLNWSSKQGIDAVLDFVGKNYFERNLDVLKVNGVLVIIGTLSGNASHVNLGDILKRRLTICGTALRSRPAYDKMHLIQEFQERTAGFFAKGRLRAIVDKTFPLEQAAQAHRYMATNQNVGKIILTVVGH